MSTGAKIDVNTDSKSLTRPFIVPCAMGLHIRAASLLVKTTSQYRSSVTIIREDYQISGKSVMDVLTLGAMKGDELIFLIEGSDAHDAMAAIHALFEANFHE